MSRTASRHPIRFGVQTAPQQISWAELRETWQEVEELGFDTLWVNDHLLASVGPSDAPNLEGWTMLEAIAALTSHVRIGAMVTSNTFRHPAVLVFADADRPVPDIGDQYIVPTYQAARGYGHLHQ